MKDVTLGVGTFVPALAPFGLRVVPDGNGVVLHLSGEFDATGHLRFEAKVRELQRNFSEIVIDLREVTFIDMSGLRSLIAVWQRSQRDAFELVIVRGPAQVQRVFELTLFGTVLPLVD